MVFQVLVLLLVVVVHFHAEVLAAVEHVIVLSAEVYFLVQIVYFLLQFRSEFFVLFALFFQLG
jgi:hypothetical protein